MLIVHHSNPAITPNVLQVMEPHSQGRQSFAEEGGKVPLIYSSWILGLICPGLVHQHKLKHPQGCCNLHQQPTESRGSILPTPLFHQTLGMDVIGAAMSAL